MAAAAAAAAACSDLKHQCIFEKKNTSLLPAENPTFLECSLSPWTHFHLPSFQSQELHHPPESEASFTPSVSVHRPQDNANYGQRRQHGRSDSFSSMSSENLSMCTEGLGFESCDDVEEDIGNNEDLQGREDNRATILSRKFHTKDESNDNNHCEASSLSKRSTTPSTSLRSFPPPISCIGRNGKPWVSFKSYRENGRFILKEIRIPNQEILHSYRENGRFRLQFAVSDDDDILEEEEEEEEEEDDDERNKT